VESVFRSEAMNIMQTNVQLWAPANLSTLATAVVQATVDINPRPLVNVLTLCARYGVEVIHGYTILPNPALLLPAI